VHTSIVRTPLFLLNSSATLYNE